MKIPHTVDVLIIGGGPAGALLACLLARRGISVLLAEKQPTHERSFRGETVAARSVQTLKRLGFGDALDRSGYLEVPGIRMWENGRCILHLDYRRFPIDALPVDIPQPTLLGAFIQSARACPSFSLAMGTSFVRCLGEGGTVHGAVLRRKDDDTEIEVRARLLVGADGRFSRVRKESGLAHVIQAAPRDFLWFKLPRPADWDDNAQLVVNRDQHLVILPTYKDLLRVGCNLPKRRFSDIRSAGLDALKSSITQLDPRLGSLVHEHVQSWEDTSFLEIFTVEMEEWARDGLLLIGDAAHTVTPVLGQGVHLAIQDAVLLAPVLAAALGCGCADRPIRAAELDGFVAARRAHKSMVTRYQRRQEASLAQHNPWMTMLRRAQFRALNLFPLKHSLLNRLINAPHGVDL